MSSNEELEHQAFEEDLQYLIKILMDSFESVDSQHYIDDLNEILYIKLEGLQDYEEYEIEEIAAPILEELDMDYEEIILLPL